VSTETTQEAPVADEAPSLPEGGEFAIVELLGHRQRAGYVTEVTRFGAALLHIDLPAKIWGGDASAWEEYTAAAMYGMHPATGQEVKAAWRREVEARARQEERAAAERERWSRAALPAGEGSDPDEDLDDRDGPF
jgi:hypothetical protein